MTRRIPPGALVAALVAAFLAPCAWGAPPSAEAPRVECRVARDAAKAEVARLARVTAVHAGRTSTRVRLATAVAFGGGAPPPAPPGGRGIGTPELAASAIVRPDGPGDGASGAAGGPPALELSATRPTHDPMRLAGRTFTASLGQGGALIATTSPVEAQTVVRAAGTEVRIETAELRLRTVRCHLRALADEVDGRLLSTLEEARRVLSAPGAQAGEEVGILDVLSLPPPGEVPAIRWEEVPASDCASLMAER